MRKNKIVVVLLLALVFALSVVFAACQLTPDEPTQHTCTSKCPDCGKCTNATCTEDACKEKCPGHHCKHVCPDCGGCLDDTCTNPICANNRCICESLIDSAKNYIDGLYKKDEVYATDRDYELVTAAYIKKTDVTIAWSIEVAEGTTAPAKIEVVNGKTMVVISTEEATAARPYTLVGVITAGKDTVTVKYERTVPVIDANLNAFYKDVVSSVTAGKQYYIGMYQANVKKALYFAGTMSDRWYATTNDIETATVVTLVAVEGGYRLQFTDKKDGKVKYLEIVTYDDAGNTKVGLYEDGAKEVVPGACTWTFDTSTKTLLTTVNKVKYFLGAYQSNETIGRSDADNYLKTSNIDVSQFPIRLIEKKAEVERNDQEKADYEISKLSIDTEIYTAGTVELPATGAKYTDVAITWTSDNAEFAAIAEGKVTYKLPTAETTVKLTATATINGKTASKTFDVVVKPLSPITVAEFLAKEKGDTVYMVEGWVVAAGGSHDKTGSFVLRDATGAAYCNNGLKVEVGDKIRVLATKDEYFGAAQMKCDSFTLITAEGETMPEYTPVDLDASTINLADYTSEKLVEIQATYYKVTGTTLKKSGNYTNAYVGDTQIISVYANSELKKEVEALVDKEVVLYGYVRGGNPSKYITLQICKIEAAGGTVVEPTDEEIVAADKAALTINTSYADTFTLPTTGANGTTITWALKEANEKVTITGGNVSFTITENTNITLVATITKGEESDTKEFAVSLLYNAPQYSVTWTDETISVKNGETALNSGDKVDLNTVITVTVTPAEGYKLASYKIGDGEAVTSVAGKTSFEITVTADCAITVEYVEAYPVKTIAEFKALSTTDTNEYKVTGIVTNMDGKAIFIQDAEGNTLYLYDLGKHADGVVVGKKVTYRGKRGEYNGLKQMASPTLVSVEDTEDKITATVLDEAAYKALVADDASKLVSLNDLVFVSGTIAAGQSLTFTLGATNVTVRIEKNGDSANIVAALKNIKAGDKVDLENVNIGWYNGAQIALSAATSVKVKELTAEEKVARVAAALESAGVTISEANKAVALPTYEGVTLTWTLPEGTTACALTEDGLSVIATALPADETKVKATATFAIDGANGTAEVEITIKSSSAPVLSTVATFTFEGSGKTGHQDGNSTTKYEGKDGEYSLTITNGTGFYTKANDAKGNGCIKLGTGKAAGKFTLTVDTSIKTVKIYIAGYKDNVGKFKINAGTEQSTTKISNNGEYDCVEIEVPANGVINFETTSGGYRAMISKIEFVA